MRLLFPVFLFLTACAIPPPPHKGGGATQDIIEPTQLVGVRQTLAQPENPASASRQEVVEIRTETLPSGTVVVTERRATTELGGSQEQAGILGAWAKVKAVAQERTTEVLLGLGLLLGAWVAWKRDNPLVASTLALGGLYTMCVGMTGAWFAVAAAGLLLVGYHKGLLGK